MTKAPERIVTSKCGKTLVHDGMKRFETDVEYIRADVHAALLKAEREKALREAQERIRKKGNLFSVSVIEAMINRTAKGADL